MRRLGGLLALALALVLPAAALGAKPIYIADNDGAVLKLNPKSGAVTTVSDDPMLGAPGGITFARNGTLLVSDFDGGAILRVDPSNGDTTLVSDSAALSQPFDLVQDKDGTIYVADEGTPGVLNVDPATGDTGIFSGGTDHFVDPFGIDIGPHRKLYVADDGSSAKGRIVRVSLKTAHARTFVKGHGLVNPIGLEMGPGFGGSQIYVADYDAAPHKNGAIFNIDPKSAFVDQVHVGAQVNESYGLDVTKGGTIWAADDEDTKGKPAIHAMSTAGLHRRNFHDPLLGSPYGVVVSP